MQLKTFENGITAPLRTYPLGDLRRILRSNWLWYCWKMSATRPRGDRRLFLGCESINNIFLLDERINIDI